MAYRMVCGSNLAGIGKSMLIYANDWDEEYPRGGTRDSVWSTDGSIADWEGGSTNHDAATAFGTGANPPATIGSCFYLLIKFADVTPKQFICSGDTGVKAFTLSDAEPSDLDMDITEGWDFGDEPGRQYSYTYHMPFGDYPIAISSNPGSPVSADRNPFLDQSGDYATNCATSTEEDCPTWVDNAYYDPDKTGNAAAHQREGQNVLFNDSHVNFESTPNCGVNKDNIWKFWPTPTPTAQQRQLSDGGEPTGVGDDEPLSEEDAFLVCEEQDMY
jgi:hypothetical protein